MKKQLFIITLLITIKTYSQNNAIIVTYNQAINNSKITKSNKPKILKDIEYILKCSKNVSHFEYIEKMSSEANRANKTFVRKAGAVGVYYKNLKTKEKYKSINNFGKSILITEKIDKTKWVLTKETKKIDKYLCYKAFYNFTSPLAEGYSIKITAWYSPEISFPFGPIGYDGLPGLILELSYLDNIFIAKSINFKKEVNITKPEGEKMTQKELRLFFQKKTGIDIKKQIEQKAKNSTNTKKEF